MLVYRYSRRAQSNPEVLGRPVRSSEFHGLWLVLRVDGVVDGTYLLTGSVEAVQADVDLPGLKPARYLSREEPLLPDSLVPASPYLRACRRLLGTTFTFRLRPDGIVSDVEAQEGNPVAFASGPPFHALPGARAAPAIVPDWTHFLQDLFVTRSLVSPPLEPKLSRLRVHEEWRLEPAAGSESGNVKIQEVHAYFRHDEAGPGLSLDVEFQDATGSRIFSATEGHLLSSSRNRIVTLRAKWPDGRESRPQRLEIEVKWLLEKRE